MLKRGIYKISWVIQVIFAKFLGGVVYLHNFRGKSHASFCFIFLVFFGILSLSFITFIPQTKT